MAEIEKSLSEYFESDRKTARARKWKSKDSVKIALLGSFTLNGFKEVLRVKCREAGLDASFYVNEYNRYVQELADEGSGFYAYRPDITFLLVDTSSILGRFYLDPYSGSEKERLGAVNGAYGMLEGLVNKFTRRGSGILVMNNFEIPAHSPLGILETKRTFGYLDMTRRLNALLRGLAGSDSVYIFDYESFASRIGKDNLTDDKMLYLADMRIAPDNIPHLCEEYMAFIRAMKGLSRKCLVLDLDNTLWGGVIGEDGFDGIRLGQTAPGSAYLDFQKHILALFKRGVILAINSNNNPSDALKVLNEHPYMVLRPEHFASIKINWENKVKNLIEIARETNIGLDSIIFLEDDKRIRSVVKKALPQVLCPALPEEAASYSRFLCGLKELDSLQITHEDRSRGQLYANERKRKESRASFADLSKYLKHLDIVTSIRRADKFTIPRIAQLAARTNQFNFSTKRYTEDQIRKFVKTVDHSVYCVDVRDRYGDYGITGALIIQNTAKRWLIDTFLLSCRVLGRNIEDAVMSAVMKRAVRKKVSSVGIRYVRTEKNLPALNFLEANGVKVSSRRTEAVIELYGKGMARRFEDRSRHIKVLMKDE